MESTDRLEPAIYKKKEGCLLIYPDGHVRFLGFWESVKHRLFGWTAQDFIDEETGSELFRILGKGDVKKEEEVMELSEKELGYNEGVIWAADWLIGQAESNSDEIKAFASNIADSIRGHQKPWGSKPPDACRVCGITCDAWKDGIQPVCPEHCDDHDYAYDEYERAHTCVNCFQHAPHDHFDN